MPIRNWVFGVRRTWRQLASNFERPTIWRQIKGWGADCLTFSLWKSGWNWSCTCDLSALLYLTTTTRWSWTSLPRCHSQSQDTMSLATPPPKGIKAWVLRFLSFCCSPLRRKHLKKEPMPVQKYVKSGAASKSGIPAWWHQSGQPWWSNISTFFHSRPLFGWCRPVTHEGDVSAVSIGNFSTEHTFV